MAAVLRRVVPLLFALALAPLACRAKAVKRVLTQPENAATVDRRSPFLKVHMRNGDVYALSPWELDTVARTVSGTGTRQDPNRAAADSGAHVVLIDSVALFETNVIKTHPSIAIMAVITGVSVGLTVICATNPKTCFGSCPTFFVSDGEREVLQAEGFSSSVAPALEATDIDALFRARPSGSRLEIRMTNEALETHVVRHVDVLAARRPKDGRVFATQRGDFIAATHLTSPRTCVGREGDCRGAVAALDDRERFSTTDSTDLAARETIELTFDAPPGDSLGLVIASRQTLVTTYVFYQVLAHMGQSAARFLASLGRGDPRALELSGTVGRLLGGIEVQIQNSAGEWATVGEMRETGPLATDVRIVPLPPGHRAARVRLRLTRGLWRVDWIALARLDSPVSPIRIAPAFVLDGGARNATVLRQVTLRGGALTTLPGDEYTFVYALPDRAAEYELFLESRGYYLEWMRREWLAEENPGRAMQLALDPPGALRAMAPEFKRQEATIEAAFWGSRYVRR